MEHGYQGLDYSTKVRHFNTSIKTYGLNVIKANILAIPDLQRDFDRCVTLFESYISSNKSSKEHTLNISKTNTDPHGRNKGGLGGGGRGRCHSVGHGSDGCGRGNGGVQYTR